MQCEDSVHVGTEAMTSGPERGEDTPEATQLISHPSLSALTLQETISSRSHCRPRGHQAVGLYACQLPKHGGLERGTVNPQQCKGHTAGRRCHW